MTINDLDNPERLARFFWRKVDRYSTPEGCWLWTGGQNGHGYGKQYTPVGGKYIQVPAHRIAYLLTFGSIQDDLVCCHHCDTPLCVNPSHLFVGTVADNVADKVAKGRCLYGDLNPSRLHPERLSRGPKHGEATKRGVKRGEQHYSRAHPEKVARGERSPGCQHPQSYQGERNGQAKLTVGLVREIRARAARGAVQRRLAAEYGVCPDVINRIVRRLAWRHVD